MKVLRANEVSRMLGISKATLWRWARQPDFPRPRKLGARAVGWLQSEIEQWLKDRPDAA